MKIRYIHILLIVLTIIGGGILGTSYLGFFDTSRTVQPRILSDDTGSYNISDIRGSFSLDEIEQYYKVPPLAIIEAFSLQKDISPESFQLKDLKEIYPPVEIEGEMYQVETDTVKVFVSLYSDIDYVSEETNHLPKQAVALLVNEDKLTAEQKQYWESHTFDLIQIKNDENETQATVDNIQSNLDIEKTTDLNVDEELIDKAISIVGKTTIAELSAMGIDEDLFKELTGLEFPDDKNIPIRDYAISNGIDFGEIRTKLESFLSSE